jgi:hypothetical protein
VVTACEVADCNAPRHANGYCPMHYQRWRKHGDPTISGRLTVAERFWAKVDRRGPEVCWSWLGSRMKRKPYGQFYNGERLVLAHRFSYELLVGPIPDGLVLDHLCQNPSCVNALAHLEPVTNGENIHRGYVAKAQTHCKWGHEFTPENTYVYRTGAGGIARKCIACHELRTGDRYRSHGVAADRRAS